MAITHLQGVIFLCLVLRRGYSHFSEDGHRVVTGAVGHSVILPCSIMVPDNLSDGEIKVLWFRNFTDKLLNCTLREGSPPVCWRSPDSPRAHVSRGVFGNADLQLSSLQESDAGSYQCWILLPDAYRRQDAVLRVHGDNQGKKGSPLLEFPSWWNLEELSSWDILLISGWPVALLLVMIFLAQKIFNNNYRKRRCIVV